MNLKSKLRKTRDIFAGRLGRVLGQGVLDEDALEKAEEILLTSDLGWELTEKIIEKLPGKFTEENVFGKNAEWCLVLAEILRDVIPIPVKCDSPSDVPEIIVVAGVNGAGKTTTIARLADIFQKQGKKVLLACADTYRAAAAEQLTIWAEKLGAGILTQLPGADPGAVAFDAVKRGISRSYDTVIIDTAGRLPNKVGLMDELSKIYRVCGKAMESSPHRVLLVLDGTVGQNALSQAEQFIKYLPVTGLVVTKLDGTAKGGAVLAMASRIGVPIEYIGVGETAADLIPFDMDDFINALLGIEADGKSRE